MIEPLWTCLWRGEDQSTASPRSGRVFSVEQVKRPPSRTIGCECRCRLGGTNDYPKERQ